MIKIQKQLGAKLRRIRLNENLTQEELAAKAKIDFTTLNKIENSKRNPSLKTIEKIARALKVSPKDLL